MLFIRLFGIFQNIFAILSQTMTLERAMQQLVKQTSEGLDYIPLRLTVALSEGGTFEPPAAAGFRVMELIRAFGLPIKAECGGACICSTCHVRVPARWRDLLPPPTSEELAKLDEIPTADDDSRLACQLIMTDELDGLEVEIQPDSFAPQHWVAG